MTKCTHYWILEPPKDKVSRGKCKLCGEERVFSNLGYVWNSSEATGAHAYRDAMKKLRELEDDTNVW